MAVARVIVQSPKVILADEPVSSLDPARAEDMLDLMTALIDGSGKALVATLHSPELIRRYFTRVIGLRQGELRFDLPAVDVRTQDLDGLYQISGNGRYQGGAAGA